MPDPVPREVKMQKLL